jgi:hypothetical protein
MNKFRFTIKLMAIAIFMFAFASMAQAQATRTWVSGVGDDVNPCSRTAPCKTFAGAISKTAVGGEIDCLDPGGFGAVTITKKITIDGTGTFGSILASSTTGVTVNGAGVIVRLRGLSINGANGTASPGVTGVRMINGAALSVEDSVIDGFNTAGISIENPATAVNELHVRNTVIRNCVTGIAITNTGTNATVMTVDNVNVTRATNGLSAGNGSRGQISNSYFGSNSGSGITASTTTSPTDFTVNDTAIAANGTGLTTGAGTHVRIIRCVITGNGNALGLGGLVDTGGNNTIMGNGTDQAPNGALKIQN